MSIAKTPSQDFLVEIGTEELPPKSLRELELAFADHVRDGLAEAELGHAGIRSFATPRRLALIIKSLEEMQPTRRIEKRGPPVAVAFGADGTPTRAATAFADGCGVPIERLGRTGGPKGEWLVYRGETPGRAAVELLPGIVAAALDDLPIARRMRWGNGTAEFVRPVHWVVMMYGASRVPGSILGQESGTTTRGHRFLAPHPLEIPDAGSYERVLLEGGSVIADFSQRRATVRRLAGEAATSSGGTAVVEDSLLDEVTALVEWPVAVLGSFDPAFLELPDEVLMATLQGHQRYFPVRGSDGRLRANFIAMSNLPSRDPEQVRRGNERVVSPRLADARFFWSQDRGSRLESRLDGLKSVVFQKGLGSLHDKSERVAALAAWLAPAVGCDSVLARRAASLGKADLLSQMVGEFPELQGLMGGHYARLDGEDQGVALAIAEQYLPRHAGDALPDTVLGLLLSVCDRADTLAGVFSLGKRPTGNKDPFGLRRAANGLLRILIERGLEVDLIDLLRKSLEAQPGAPKDQQALLDDLYEFIIDRARSYYLEGLAPGIGAGEVSGDLFDAVRARRPSSLADLHARILALRAFMEIPAASSLAAANKRIANILRSGGDLPPDVGVNPALFEFPAEAELHSAIRQVEPEHAARLAARDYGAAMGQLAALRPAVDSYFESVLVMADDPARRRNRLTQLQQLRAMFLDIADLSRIPTT